MTTPLAEVDSQSHVTRRLPEAPFRGLEPFRYIDSPIFFARFQEVRKLLRNITMYRGVLFYGDSGSGKSSLINAGLIPKIVDEGFIPDRIRVQPQINKELIIERIAIKRHEHPPFLESSFISNSESASNAQIVMSVGEFQRRLEDLPASTRPLLIFDQFEEIVTLFEEGVQPRIEQKPLTIQKLILDALVELMNDHRLPVKLLFVFREDYLAKLTKLFTKCPDLPDHYLRLTSPRKESLHEVIRGPFDKFPGSFERELSQELCLKLASEIEEGNESELINLSEIQICCQKLWESTNPAQLLETRHVEGLLEDFLSESLTKLPANLIDPAVALLRRMVTASGTRNVISEDDLIYLARREERASPETLRRALDSLTEDTKLIRREQRQNTYFYQIVSEFLIPWIRRQKEEQRLRLQRRRAYTWVAICLAIAFAAAMAAYWVYVTRTKEVLKDTAVREANTARDQAVAEAAQLRREVENLRGIISGDQSKAAINSLLEQRDSYQQASQKTQVELDQSKTIVQALTARVEILSKQLQDQQPKDEEIGKVRQQNTQLVDENARLTKDLAYIREDLKKALEELKAKTEVLPLPAIDTSSLDTPTKIPERAGSVHAVWTLMPEQVMKDVFGSKMNDKFFCIQITIANGLEKSVLIREIQFEMENKTHLSGVDYQVVLPFATNAQQQLRVFQFAFNGNLVIGQQQVASRVLFIPKSLLIASGSKIDPNAITKLLGSVSLEVVQVDVTKSDFLNVKP